jgi:hypothetical protein
MKEVYFDDLKPGDQFESEAVAVPAKAIIEFAEKFDPQKFHLNAKSAERSIFKGLIASGWHTAAITMKLFVKTLNFAEGAIGRRFASQNRNSRSPPIAVQTRSWDHPLAQYDNESAWRGRADDDGKRASAAAEWLNRGLRGLNGLLPTKHAKRHEKNRAVNKRQRRQQRFLRKTQHPYFLRFLSV